jgi:hypothetical protein
MSGYRFVQTRERRIRLHGSYSYDYRMVVDLTQTGLHAKVGKVFAGSPSSPGAFLGWALPHRLEKRSSCVAGLDKPYTQHLISTPNSYRKVFGPIYTYDASNTTACIIQIKDAATGDVLESFDAGWDGITGYYASVIGTPGTPSGFLSNDNVGLFNPGSVLTVTATYDGSHGGDFEFVADMAEIEWRRYASGYDNNELEPVTSGTFPINRVQYFEATKPGGVFGWICGANDETTPIVAYNSGGVLDDLYWPFIRLNVQVSDGQSSTATLDATWDGGGYTQTPTGMTASNANGSITATSVSATTSTTTVKRSQSASFFPVKWKYVGRANAIAFGSSIPDSSQIEWTAGISSSLYTDSGTFPISRGAAGEFAFSYREGAASAGGNSNGSGAANTSHDSGSSSVLPPSQFGCRFTTTGFSAVKPQVGRFCVRGPGWDQFSVYQEQYKYYAKDPWHAIRTLPYSAKGWYPGATAAITSLSIVSGKLQIVTSGTGGADTDRAAVLKLLTDRVEMRHVGIRIRSVGADNLPFTLVLGHDAFSPITGEEYASTTGADGVWVERMFDRYDQHYPLLDYTGILPTDTLNQVAVKNLAVSSTYEVEWIRGERMNHSKIYTGADLEFITDTLLTRAVTLKNDASELSFIPPAAPVDVGDNPSSWVMSDLAVAPFDQPADVYDTVSPGTTTYLDPAYHQNSTAGFYAYLEGLGFDGSHLDQDVAGAGNETTLRAYPLAVAIDGYPGAGDIFGSGAYSEDTPVHFDMVVRGQAFGPVLGALGGTQEVVLTELTSGGADNGERGRGTPDGDGYYKTGSPYARALGFLANWVRAWMDDAYPSTGLVNKIGDGFRWWLLWRVHGEILWPSSDTNRMMRAVRSYILGTDAIIIGFLTTLPFGWQDRSTGISGGHPCVRYGKGVNDGRIIVVYEDSGAIVRRETLDEGSTWSVPTTIFAAGEKPTMTVTPTGVEHHFCNDGAGAILTRILDPQGVEIEAETTVVVSGADDDALTAFPRDGYIYLLYKDTGGSLVTVRSIDGVTYS